MSELSKIKRELSQLEKTERELNLKQLQIKVEQFFSEPAYFNQSSQYSQNTN